MHKKIKGRQNKIRDEIEWCTGSHKNIEVQQVYNRKSHQSQKEINLLWN